MFKKKKDKKQKKETKCKAGVHSHVERCGGPPGSNVSGLLQRHWGLALLSQSTVAAGAPTIRLCTEQQDAGADRQRHRPPL